MLMDHSADLFDSATLSLHAHKQAHTHTHTQLCLCINVHQHIFIKTEEDNIYLDGFYGLKRMENKENVAIKGWTRKDGESCGKWEKQPPHADWIHLLSYCSSRDQFIFI